MEKTEETQLEQPTPGSSARTFTFDGTEYNLDSISDNAKSCILHIQKLDASIAEKVFELDEAKMTRMAYISVLKSELSQA